jgi:hypothetical protein
VIGPIGKSGSPERRHADLLLNAVIKHVLCQPNLGYLVKRADEDTDPGMIGDRLVSDIIHAELVVGDLTDLNANAFYELGIRHSTEKPTIHIAKAGTVLPFDNVAHRTIFVDLTDWGSIEEARKLLANSANAIKAPGYRVSNPITQANASFKMRQSEDPRDRVLADMQERMSALENMISRKPAVPVSGRRMARATYNLSLGDLAAAEALVALLRHGDKDNAIRFYRDDAGADEKRAQEFIEAILRDDWGEAITLHQPDNRSKIQAERFMAAIRDLLYSPRTLE